MNIINGKIKILKNKYEVEVIEEQDNTKEDMLLLQHRGVYNHPRKDDPVYIIQKDGEPKRLAIPIQENLNINTEEGDVIIGDYNNYIRFNPNKGIYIKGKIEFADDVKINGNVEILGNLEVKGSLTNKKTQVSLKGHAHAVSSKIKITPPAPTTPDFIVAGVTEGDI